MNNPNAARNDKRSFIRMEVNTPAKITVIADNQQEIGICKNLSGNGMLLELGTDYSVGSEFVVHVTSELENGPTLDASCTVMRSEKTPDGDNYLVGIIIDKIL
jgi:hypothetical protein